MSEKWQVRAILHEANGALRLGLVATREISGKQQNTSGVVAVTSIENAHHEARAYCAELGVADYSFEDRRARVAAR